MSTVGGADNAPSILFIGAGLAPAARRMVEEAGVRLVTLPPYPAEETVIDIVRREGPVAIVVRSGLLTGPAIRAAESVKLIAKHGVGVDPIDVATATALGIPVSFAAGTNAQSVAEHALALLFSVARRVPALDGATREGRWQKEVGTELTGKTLGLIGLGAISRRLVELVSPFHMSIIVFDPYLRSDATPSGVLHVDDLDDLLRSSDVISLHCPLTPETQGMIGAPQFAKMRDGAILINTARGGLIDEDALTAALVSGKLTGAGLDTLATEPPSVTGPLWSAPNLVVTPHVGADTIEARERVGTTVMQHALDVLSGRYPADWMLANPSVLEKIGSQQRGKENALPAQ